MAGSIWRGSPPGGFTLVEILVTSAILVVVLSALLVVQQSVSRRTLTTDAKRDAIEKTHRAYEAVHFVLANSPRCWIPTRVQGLYEYSEASGAPVLFTPSFEVLASGQGKGISINGVRTVDGVWDGRFFRESEVLTAFSLESHPPDSTTPVRERSELYSRHFFEIEADRLRFSKAFWQPGRPPGDSGDEPQARPPAAPAALFGGVSIGSFKALCGYVPER